MQTAAIQTRIDTSAMPLEKLAGNANISEAEKAQELGRQFEAVLLRKILSEAQKTVFHSKFQNDSFANGIYQDMITNQMAESISKSGAIGLGHILSQQVTRQQASSLTPTTHD